MLKQWSLVGRDCPVTDKTQNKNRLSSGRQGLSSHHKLWITQIDSTPVTKRVKNWESSSNICPRCEAEDLTTEGFPEALLIIQHRTEWLIASRLAPFFTNLCNGYTPVCAFACFKLLHGMAVWWSTYFWMTSRWRLAISRSFHTTQCSPPPKIIIRCGVLHNHL